MKIRGFQLNPLPTRPHFQRKVRHRRSKAQKHFARSRKLLLQGNWLEAFEAAKAAIQKNPKDKLGTALAYVDASQVAIRLHRWQVAETYSLEALKYLSQNRSSPLGSAGYWFAQASLVESYIGRLDYGQVGKILEHSQPLFSKDKIHQYGDHECQLAIAKFHYVIASMAYIRLAILPSERQKRKGSLQEFMDSSSHWNEKRQKLRTHDFLLEVDYMTLLINFSCTIQGDDQTAITHSEGLIEDLTQVSSNLDHPIIGQLSTSLGTFYLRQKNYQKCIEASEVSYRIAKTSLIPETQDFVLVLLNLSKARCETGQVERSLQYLKELLGFSREKEFVGHAPAVHGCRNAMRLGQAFAKASKHTEAIETLEIGIGLADAFDKPASTGAKKAKLKMLVEIHSNLAVIYLNMGNPVLSKIHKDNAENYLNKWKEI